MTYDELDPAPASVEFLSALDRVLDKGEVEEWLPALKLDFEHARWAPAHELDCGVSNGRRHVISLTVR